MSYTRLIEKEITPGSRRVQGSLPHHIRCEDPICPNMRCCGHRADTTLHLLEVQDEAWNTVTVVAASFDGHLCVNCSEREGLLDGMRRI